MAVDRLAATLLSRASILARKGQHRQAAERAEQALKLLDQEEVKVQARERSRARRSSSAKAAGR